jgi:cysteinyl-tRNA synthetase
MSFFIYEPTIGNARPATDGSPQEYPRPMESLFLYNTLSGHKGEFVPLVPDHVAMYVCGPTVYDRIHLGNARCMLVFDTLYRVLKHIYPNVNYVRNITDVDDKINAEAKKQGIPIAQLTEQTTQWFHEDVALLGLLQPTHEPRATQWIGPMIEMIAQMIDARAAYVSQGHVLFDVSVSENYGRLSNMNLDHMESAARIEPASYKDDPLDFVLWKPSSEDEPGWYSPWGHGRPGWHIECSAMSAHFLGSMIDIHGGGRDLMFPHHENERAQTCACFEQEECAQCWMHTGMLVVAGQKMSKSLGNFVTLHDALKDQPAEVLRWALLTSHYRHALDWTESLVKQARMSVDSLYGALARSQNATGAGYGPESIAKETIDPRYWAALCDDLNTPQALNRLQQLTRSLHKNPKDAFLAQRLYASAYALGLVTVHPQTWFQPEERLALSKEDIAIFIEKRKQARAAKDFSGADAIRSELLEKGIILEDSGAETSWRVI